MVYTVNICLAAQSLPKCFCGSFELGLGGLCQHLVDYASINYDACSTGAYASKIQCFSEQNSVVSIAFQAVRLLVGTCTVLRRL